MAKWGHSGSFSIVEKSNNNLNTYRVMAKLNESDKRFMGCLRKVVIGGVIMYALPYIGIGIVAWVEHCRDNKNQERLRLVEEYIENYDFVQARRVLMEYDGYYEGELYLTTKEKLSTAQVSHLIHQGQFSLAKQIAEEDGNPTLYQSGLMNQLIDIYDKHPKKDIVKALSLVEIDVTYDQRWDVSKQEYKRAVNEIKYNVQVQSFNNDLDQFCKSLYAMGKKEDAKAFLKLLKPDYNGSTAKINKIKSQYR